MPPQVNQRWRFDAVNDDFMSRLNRLRRIPLETIPHLDRMSQRSGREIHSSCTSICY